MADLRIIGASLALVASLLACATPKKGTPPDGPPAPDEEQPDGMPARTEVAAPSPDTAPAPVDLAGPGNGPGPDTGAAPPDGPCGTPTDPRNCGTCGHDCTKLANIGAPATVTCQAGQCVVPPAACATGYAHCSASADDGCEADLSRPQTCGGCTAVCGTGKMCALSGQTHQCVACGGAGQPCCDGNTCGAGTACSNGTCTTTCVPGATCGTNNMCTKSLTSCTTGTPVCVATAINEGIACATPTCSGSSSVEKRCSGGQCVSQTPKSCMYGCSGGMCNADCPSGSNKTATGCTPCGAGTEASPQPCCEKGSPCSGKRICCTQGHCGGSGDRCIPCGIVLHPCCGPQKTDDRANGPTTGTCDTGLVCTDQGVYQQPQTNLNSYLCDPPP
jgi:hypothetical protein